MTALEHIAAFAGVTVNGQSPILTALSRKQLPALFHGLGYRRGAEIGVWKGTYSEELCQGIPGLELRCVDPWRAYDEYQERKNDPLRLEAAYAEACDRLRPYGCLIDRRVSVEAAASVPDGSLDFVYIDSNHRKPFVLQDLAAWRPKVRLGGILAGHDYVIKGRQAHKSKHAIEVQDAVDEYVAAHQIAPVFLAAADKLPSFFWVVA